MTATQIAAAYEYSIEELRDFTAEYLHQIEECHFEMSSAAEEIAAADAAVAEELAEPLDEAKLQGYWITSKEKRIAKYQEVADGLLTAIISGKQYDATTLREARSYMMYVANELGQLPLRGAGKSEDDSAVSYTINGVDVEMMK